MIPLTRVGLYTSYKFSKLWTNRCMLHDVLYSANLDSELATEYCFTYSSKIRSLGFDDKFLRVWEYYFDYSAAGFVTRILGDYQVIFKPLHRSFCYNFVFRTGKLIQKSISCDADCFLKAGKSSCIPRSLCEHPICSFLSLIQCPLFELMH